MTEIPVVVHPSNLREQRGVTPEMVEAAFQVLKESGLLPGLPSAARLIVEDMLAAARPN